MRNPLPKKTYSYIQKFSLQNRWPMKKTAFVTTKSTLIYRVNSFICGKKIIYPLIIMLDKSTELAF